jgi:hypothetical protein
MKPDRTNYEIWLVDYLDGNLDGEQVRQLLSFLEENPDIREEFDGLSVIPLHFEEVSFRNRTSLKRSADELSEAQFELLCVASLENDLSPEQKRELDDIITGNEERRKSAELLSRIKLKPSEHTFRYKHRLKKLTLPQKLIRVSAIGLSAAATILIMFTVLKNPVQVTGYQLPATGSLEKGNEESKNQTVVNVPDKKEELKVPIAENLIKNLNESASGDVRSLSENKPIADSSLQVANTEINSIAKITGITEVPQESVPVNASLVAMNLTPVDPFNEEGGNAVGNFFSRIIREKVLKSPNPERGNLKAYEVADAGITGLNKLFGSNMKLEKTLAENGEVRSVYFNSRLLKINAPVKKAEPLE